MKTRKRYWSRIRRKPLGLEEFFCFTMGTDASITTSGVHNAGTIDNECNPIAKYDDMQSVTALDVGAGHIILQSVADPRLV